MCGQRAAVHLDPAPDRADQRAGPQANSIGSKDGVGHFQHDAAHVLVSEEIVASELQVVQDAPCVQTRRDRCRFDDNLAAVADPGGLYTLHSAQRGGL